MASFRPMLAPPNNPLKYPNYFKELQFPLLFSPKLDGIRCTVKKFAQMHFTSDLETIHDESTAVYRCMSREFLELPSRQVQEFFTPFEELDGEIIVGDETDFDVFNRTQSYVMSADKWTDDLKFRVFDYADPEIMYSPFEERLAYAGDQIEYYKRVANALHIDVSLVKHIMCRNLEELLQAESEALELGYEGGMMRAPLGKYKGADGGANRGTWKEGLIYKLKRFEDFEAQVIGFIEAKENQNEKQADAFGLTKRSTAKAGMVAGGTLGKLICRMQDGKEAVFGCGVMRHPERLYVWEHQDEYLFKYVTIRHFPHGAKDNIRMGRFNGWRDKMDFNLK
jgi:DNA ligase-1